MADAGRGMRACVVATAVFVLAMMAGLRGGAQAGALGVFEGQADVGSVTPPGTAAFDRATGSWLRRASNS